ncbi:MAG: hypothetical protein LBP74_05315, partial [Treponema sp.]|nr:hypothetical protein [Treponema sp.]
MLCINIDTTKYTQLSEAVLRLAGLNLINTSQSPKAEDIPPPVVENFYENMEEIIRSVLRELDLDDI